MKEKSEKLLKDITEFIDDEGTSWIQTSAEDLFSVKELNDILSTIEKDTGDDEVILARIDFHKVNKEYYNAAKKLYAEVKKKDAKLKEFSTRSKEIIDRKNKKLKELIEYIKKLHIFIKYMQEEKGIPEGMAFPAESAAVKDISDGPEAAADKPAGKTADGDTPPPKETYVPVYEEVEEIYLTEDVDTSGMT